MSKANKPVKPPKLFRKLLRWFCASDLLEEIEGDLEETFSYNSATRGTWFAKLIYIKEVVFLIRPSVIKKLKFDNSNNTVMLQNYAKVGFRNILKYKVFSFINVFGLAVSMSVSLLIILMLADQHQYDQFHSKKDRIYRILTAHNDGNTTAATTPFSTLEAFNENYSLAEHTTSLRRGIGGDAVYKKKFTQMIGYFADPDFFEVFSYELSKGNPTTALTNPNSMIISEEISRKLFGNSNPLGKTVDFTNRGLDFDDDESGSPDFWGTFTITGVIPINYYKTHLRFDVLVSKSSLNNLYQQEKVHDLSQNWSNYYQAYNYVVLNEASSEENLSQALSDLSHTKFSELEEMQVSYLISQSILDFRPGPLLNNAPSISLPMPVYYILSLLALVILLLACLNYTNLSIARAITRSKEIGIRKVTGARRKDLIFQFLSESIITSFLALLLANLVLYFVKSAFMDLWVNQYLNFDLAANLYIYGIFLGFAIFMGAVAGIFPALRLSKQQPVQALKALASSGKTKMSLRKSLTVLQFVVSLLFIITAIVIHNQFRHVMEHDYGFETENILTVNLQSNDYEKVKAAFSSIPGVSTISGSEYLPSTGRTENMALKVNTEEEPKTLIAISADSEFIDVLDFETIAGNIKQPLTDDGLTIVINREAASVLGYQVPAEIIGESFEMYNGKYVKVIGVIENFTFHLLFNGRSKSPLIIYNNPKRFTMANLSIHSTNRSKILADMSLAWESIDPVHPFTYEFYDENLANNNRGIFDIVSIVGFVAFLAVTIASLGLLGIVIYTAERRTKEVGIRKILGSSNVSLTFLLSKEFLKLLLIAIWIAAPLAYVLNNFWLNFMTVKVDFGLGTVLLGIFILLGIGLLTIGSQTLKTASSNPIEALKTE